MKAKIYINRHVVQANKKQTKETGVVVDNPCIAVRTSKGVTYTNSVLFPCGAKLVQDATNPICSGATIWIEVPEAEKLAIA